MTLMREKILLRKRALIETVNGQLENICQIEHTRHRSLDNFVANQFLDKKTTLKNIAKA